MCWFITIGIPATARDALARNPVSRCRLALTPQTATPTTALFPSGLSCVLVTRGGCACELVAKTSDDAAAIDALRARGIRAGWSAAKIARAIDGRRVGEPRLSEAAVAFRQFVAELVRETGTVWLFAHFHAGNPETDAVEAMAAAVLNVDEFVRAGFPADTLVTVRA